MITMTRTGGCKNSAFYRILIQIFIFLVAYAILETTLNYNNVDAANLANATRIVASPRARRVQKAQSNNNKPVK